MQNFRIGEGQSVSVKQMVPGPGGRPVSARSIPQGTDHAGVLLCRIRTIF